MHQLFSDHFLAGIEQFSLEVRPAPPRLAHGAILSRRNGASLEFRDYQAYVPGDDLRRVDWAVYGRTRHLFVRRFEHPTAVPVFILVDASASMKLETPSRYETAARVAAAVASGAVAGHNPLRVVVADGNTPAPRAVSGRRGLVQVLADLAADRTPAGAGPAAALQALLPALASQGKGVLVIISDFFEESGVQSLIDLLRQIPQRLVLLRITQPWDINPDIQGDLELEDCETLDRLNVSTDSDVLMRYRQAYRSYFDTLDGYVTSRQAKQVIFDASLETLPQLERLFPGGVLSI